MVTDKYSIRKANESLVLEHIILHKSISRVDIAHSTRLNKATVSDITKSLIQKQIIEETGEGLSSSKGGRKPVFLQINKMAGLSISINLKPSGISWAIHQIDGTIIEKNNISTPITYSYALEYIEDIVLKCNALIPNYVHGIIGMTIGISGLVYKNKIHFTPYYDLDKFQLFNDLTNTYNFPIFLENEANLAALGEFAFLKKKKNIISLSIGNGIGAGLIINNKLYAGLQGHAGEIGHTIVVPNGINCPCGNKGCLEQYCSEKAILEAFNSKTNSKYSYNELIDAYKNNDSVAVSLLNKMINYLAICTNNLIVNFSPDIIYFNGYLTHNIPSLLPEIEKKLSSSFTNQTSLKISETNETAILYGCASLTITKYFSINNLKFHFPHLG